ncbi:Tn5045 transposase [Acidithiobacillus caldus SM-1]|uniref:Tn5045 transposase n=1 Tax=Acidithiobacillus caldus (strain SM-1) TaxID=990288 RepID=F9ZR24_ACICS|nr:Tn5045 transposase [Acidithiobacillus caldus SM-1]
MLCLEVRAQDDAIDVLALLLRERFTESENEARKVGPRLLNAPAGTKRPTSHRPPATIAKF